MKGFFSRRSRKHRADPQELLQTIFALIQTRTLDESRRVVETHSELLTDEAGNLMEQLAEAQEDSNARRVVEEHRALLRRCREVGMEAAFAKKTGPAGSIPIPPEFQADLRQAREALQRYLRTGDRTALDHAATAWEHILNHTAFAVAPERFQLAALNDAGEVFVRRYQAEGRRGDLNLALTCWQQAVECTPPDSPELPGFLNNLGIGLRDRYARTGRLEDLEQAIRLYEQAVERTPPDSPNLPSILTNLGAGLSDRYARTGRLAELEEAIRVFQQAVQRTSPDSPDLAGYLNNLGTGLRNRYARTGQLADLEQAVRVYQQAVQRTPPDSPDLPSLLNNLGTGLRARYARTGQLADLEEAVRVFQQTVQRTPPDSPNLPSRLNNLGAGLSARYGHTGQLADLEEAIRVYQQSVQRTSPDSPDLPGCLDNLGTSLRYLYAHIGRLEDLEQAVEVYDKTMAALEQAFLLSPVAYQVGQQGRWAGLIARAVETYRQAGAIAQALAIAEGSKSRLLTTLLGWGQLPAPPTVPPSLAQREQDLAARLAALDTADLARHGRTTPSGEGAGRVAHLRQRQALVEELNVLWEQMIHDSGNDPEVTDYVELRRGDRPDWEDLARLAANLGSDTALLSLFTTGEQTLLFVLRAGMDAPQVVEAPLGGTGWEVVLRRFLREVHFTDRTGRRGETWLRPLLPLLEAAAPHLPGARQVVFAPQGGGHLLPWGLLARRAGWEAPLVTVPALGLLERVLGRPASDGTGALVVGNPTGELRYAQEEARRVARILGTRPLVGRRATRQAILSRLGEVGLAHFATHAYFAAGSPLDSGIVLADGVLTAREILERGLRAPEFLALSACQTGMAGSLGGDEMAGLSQALLYAGARSLLVSLWTVNDLATAHLMTGFYHRWRKEGQDKATALRDAMDATRQARPEWAHTYYWGAFTLVGDWR